MAIIDPHYMVVTTSKYKMQKFSRSIASYEYDNCKTHLTVTALYRCHVECCIMLTSGPLHPLEVLDL